MLLGIDYGTTRTVIAAVDRGNYPIASFHAESGETHEWYPSVIAQRNGELRYGFEAVESRSEEGWTHLRSLKRLLSTLGPNDYVDMGTESFAAMDLLTGFIAQLRTDLCERSNLRVKRREWMDVIISVPANSNSNQRFMTLEAFRRAGFNVTGGINEPSAAGLEYAHYYLKSGTLGRRGHVIIYDLGGGTFDASVISIADSSYEVMSSDGIARAGGDDFDHILMELALERAGIGEAPLEARFALLEECREKKEGLHANTRKLAIDLEPVNKGAGEIVINVAEYYERCRPLVMRTLEVMDRLMETTSAGSEIDWRSVAAIYMVGGSSDLPLVSRLLREKYGRQVRRSPYPHAAAAIGLAIRADSRVPYTLRERFTRNFGVWRELEEGRSVALDVIFEKDTLLPRNGESAVRVRGYQPSHNIGHFRYLECSRVDGKGHPAGDITLWDEVYFPFQPELEVAVDLDRLPVSRLEHPAAHIIEERYSCDQNGIIEVSILNRTSGNERTYKLRQGRANLTLHNRASASWGRQAGG